MKNWHPCQPLCFIIVNDLTYNIDILIRHNNPTLHPHLVDGGCVCSSQFIPCTYTRFYFVLHHVCRLLTFKYSVSYIKPPSPPPLVIRDTSVLVSYFWGNKIIHISFKTSFVKRNDLSMKTLWRIMYVWMYFSIQGCVWSLNVYTVCNFGASWNLQGVYSDL